MLNRAYSIVRAVELVYDLSPNTLLSREQSGWLNWPRAIAVCIVRLETGLPLREIGGIFRRNASTIQIGCERVFTRMRAEPEFERRVEQVILQARGRADLEVGSVRPEPPSKPRIERPAVRALPPPPTASEWLRRVRNGESGVLEKMLNGKAS